MYPRDSALYISNAKYTWRYFVTFLLLLFGHNSIYAIYTYRRQIRVSVYHTERPEVWDASLRCKVPVQRTQWLGPANLPPSLRSYAVLWVLYRPLNCPPMTLNHNTQPIWLQVYELSNSLEEGPRTPISCVYLKSRIRLHAAQYSPFLPPTCHPRIYFDWPWFTDG